MSVLTQTKQDFFDLKQIVDDNRLKSLWRLMNGYRLTYFSAVFSLGIASVGRTATMLLLAYFIDTYLLEGDRTYALSTIALSFIGLAVLQGIFTFVSGRLAAHTAESIVQRLRDYLLDHIQRLPFTYHDKTSTGDLIQRSTSDVDTVRRFFAEQATAAGRISLIFIINLTALLYINVELALWSIVVIPLMLFVSYLFFSQISQRFEDNQAQEGKVSSVLQENLSGVGVVKAFARQAHEEEKFDAANSEKKRLGIRLLTMHSLFWPVTDVLCAAQMLGGFTLGALMVMDGTITIGTYLAYSGLVIWIIWPMRMLGRLIVQMSMGMVSVGRITEIIREDREIIEEDEASLDFVLPDRVDGAITFEGVGFAYETENLEETKPTAVLQDITFECEPGQCIALLGSTGSGKTSLINLLPRFYEYGEGRILLDGRELTKYPRAYLRNQIGIVEQEPFLFSRTVRENITYGVDREISQTELEDAARSAAIHDVIVTKFPDGYNTLVGERGTTLSGGQKQRLAIARTLLKDPRILVLDDSTSAVDTETEALIRHAVNDLMKGRTTFIIAHRIQSIQHADLILVMNQGRIVQSGTHDELVNQPGMYRSIYEAQTRLEDELSATMRV